MPELLRPNIANQMVCPVGVPVGMTIKTGNAKTGPVSSPVFGGIKLCCGNWVTSKRNPSSCLGFKSPLKISRNYRRLSVYLRNITQIGSRGQINRGAASGRICSEDQIRSSEQAVEQISNHRKSMPPSA